MSTYVYMNKEGTKMVEREFPIGTHPRSVEVDGERMGLSLTAPRIIVRESDGGQTGPRGGVWQTSKANGCMTWQVKRAQEVACKLGAPNVDYVEVAPGMSAPQFRSAGQKNKWLKAHQRVDHDAGYSAPCPGDFKDKELPVAVTEDRKTKKVAKRKLSGTGV